VENTITPLDYFAVSINAPHSFSEFRSDDTDLRVSGDSGLLHSRRDNHRARLAVRLGVADNFALDLDTQGYHFPSAIAFVPTPGSGPKDPLYFITELRGTIKVVTNDRSVHIFADGFFHSQPRKELPDLEGETGMAGVCLEPSRGYVFVTYAYTDSAGFAQPGLKLSPRQGPVDDGGRSSGS